MQITFDTNNLSDLDLSVLALLSGAVLGVVDETVENEDEVVEEPTPAPVAKRAAARKPAPEPEPEPEPIAEEPVEEDEAEESGEDEDIDGVSDEDLLALAVKKATEMVAGGEASKVREALDAAGASRVRELNAANVRDFFKALS